MKCQNCSSNIKAEQRFCPSCGTEVELNKTEDTSFVKSTRKFPKTAKWGLGVASVVIIGILAFNFFNKQDAVGKESPGIETSLNETKENKKENEILHEQEEPVHLEQEAFYNYWGDEDTYIIYLNDNTLFVEDVEKGFLNSFSYENKGIHENTMTIGLKDIRENDSVELFKSHAELIVEIDSAASELNISGEALGTNAAIDLQPKSEDQIDKNFALFVTSDGAVGVSNYQGLDLTLEDFKGYWMPFNSHSMDDLYPLGGFGFAIGEKGTIVAFMNSEVYTTPILDYTINGNTLRTVEEFYDGIDFHSWEIGDRSTPYERRRGINEYTLFKEENDRDRLITNAGQVFQRISAKELGETSMGSVFNNHPYPLFAEDLDKSVERILSSLNQLSEDQFVILEEPLKEYDVYIENYPYSIGALSEAQLYNERQIIQGSRPHPEENINVDEAIEQLVSGSYERTASFGDITHSDTGYYFSENSDSDSFGLITVGAGGRIEWQSTPGYGEITDVSFEDHIFTVTLGESNFREAGASKRFYRISKDIIYVEDENGEFSERFAQGTTWDDFGGLPNRNE